MNCMSVLSEKDGRALAVVTTEGSASNLCHLIIPKMVPAPVNQLTEADKTVINWAQEHNVGLECVCVCVCVCVCMYVCVCVCVCVGGVGGQLADRC